MSSELIYAETENFVKTLFSGSEEHQELRKKIIKLPTAVRENIKAAAAFRGCKSKKDQVAEAVYWILNALNQEPLATCPTCAKEYRGKYYSIIEGYKFHGYCSTSCRSKHPTYKAKLEATNLARAGHKNNMHGKETRSKTKQKWIEKYGVENPMQSDTIKAKAIATNQRRRGVNWPAQDSAVWKKYETTMFARYGVLNGFQHENVKKTMMERYGVEHCTQNPDIFRKTLRGLKSTKRDFFPSGAEYTYQGYENVAVQILLHALREQDLVIGDPTKIPVIEYWNPVKQKMCHYFPDIWIPSQNLIIEVKSTWTMKRQLQENLAKHQASLNAGFRHEIWICSKDKLLEIAC